MHSLCRTVYQRILHRSGICRFSSTSCKPENVYIVPMFPYPSGSLHMGHVRVYTISDCIARYYRIKNSKNNVLHPMGWDAFGLPAENAAIKNGISPSKWTNENIAQMKEQLSKLDYDFSWEQCELKTCDPAYYKWTQWLFLKLYEHGLVELKDGYVNWDPVDQTVLANEQVDAEGKSWRSGAKVERKKLRQWFIRTTYYAQELYDEIEEEGMSNWPEKIKALQKKWIGPSKGHYVSFPLKSKDGKDCGHLKVFTTMLFTLPKVEFLAIGKEHDLVDSSGVDYADGVKLRDFEAVNPVSQEKLPIYMADYVISSYGTSAVMGVPSEDERDKKFAEKQGISSNSSNRYDGMSKEQLMDIIDSSDHLKNLITPSVAYKLHDWQISRQRYWGTPIPMIHCTKCGVVPVKEEELPVILPVGPEIKISGKGGSPLSQMEEWKKTVCPKCLDPSAQRETDTMDTFVDSSWYFMRYLDSFNTERIFDVERVKPFLPVQLYIGGQEHSILHLFFARFVCKFLHDKLGLITSPIPFSRILAQGMVLGETFKDSQSGAILSRDQVTRDSDGTYREREGGAIVSVTHEKMSKSKLNGIKPEEVLKSWSSDIVRFFILFKSPPEMGLVWDSNSIKGVERFFHRLDEMINNVIKMKSLPDPCVPSEQMEKFASSMHKLTETTLNLLQMSQHAFEESLAINTIPNALMKYQTLLQNYIPFAWKGRNPVEIQVFWESMNLLLILLQPFSPKISQKLLANWQNSEVFSSLSLKELSSSQSGKIIPTFEELKSRLPSPDSGELSGLTIVPLVIKVNGKTEKKVMMPRGEISRLHNDGKLKEFVLKEIDITGSISKFIVPHSKVKQSFLVNVLV